MKLRRGEGMSIFPQGSSIEPGGIRIIAHEGAIFLSEYGFLPDFELIDSEACSGYE
jgi:hypothetical protein